ncbi:hypothetical protein [Dyadobacter sp. CY347]|uniref:hypothetical protein n=1 Tax=Dyadobacter sp. CY347 TaxID=2909336 RepID=UPI001F256C6D|nr:hypothetical protein [Dyadobacter sp. CY347]MCF2487774.1 hypothetical protein [Dyadobacter sp. CY347]
MPRFIKDDPILIYTDIGYWFSKDVGDITDLLPFDNLIPTFQVRDGFFPFLYFNPKEQSEAVEHSKGEKKELAQQPEIKPRQEQQKKSGFGFG